MRVDLFILFHCLRLAMTAHLMPVISIAPGNLRAPHKQINEYILHVAHEINDGPLSPKCDSLDVFVLSF